MTDIRVLDSMLNDCHSSDLLLNPLLSMQILALWVLSIVASSA